MSGPATERILMAAPLAPRPAPPTPGLRAPSDADRTGLAMLMVDAYRGTIDAGDSTEADAHREIETTFGGGYGHFLGDCSVVIVEGDRVVAAALLTRWRDAPFVAFSMTAADRKRRGLGRACLLHAMEELRRRGESEVRLVVSVANIAAVELYRRLGFVAAQP
jgi:GNAT superfamily N-acetyltransferase